MSFIPLQNKSWAGFALVLVLWMLSLMTIMAGSFALTMRREIAVSDSIKNNAQALAIAETGIAIAELMLIASQDAPDGSVQKERWYADGSIYQISYRHAKVRLRLLSETGKIDINQADQKLLKAIFSRVPIENSKDREKNIAKLVAAVLDWRDEDDRVRNDGAEKAEYRAQGLAYQPHNKPFQSLEELQMVLGMDEAIYKTIEPVITIYSGQGQVDKTASKEVLSLLPGLNPGQVRQFVAARREAAISGKPLTFPLASRYINAGADGSTGQNGAITIISEAKLEDGSQAAVNAILMHSEIDSATPFQALKWQRNYSNKVSLFSAEMDEFLVAQYNEPQFDN